MGEGKTLSGADEGSLRIGGLRRFAVAITLLNIIGHTYFGFEQSYAQPFVALVTAYCLEIGLEWIVARTEGRLSKYCGSPLKFIDFLLPAHITALAVSMLIYVNDTLLPVAFATAVAIGSKAILRAPVGNGTRHFYNPSNFGITVTLLLFAWVGIAPPYQFTENLDHIGDWALPVFIICSGTLLNGLFTKRLPLIAAWVLGFVLQALARHLFFDSSLYASLLPLTGVPFILFTFYMVTDPATTPATRKGQVIFGLTTAAAYGLLMISHVVFGLFFALTFTSTLRGIALQIASWRRAPKRSAETMTSFEVATRPVTEN